MKRRENEQTKVKWKSKTEVEETGGIKTLGANEFIHTDAHVASFHSVLHVCIYSYIIVTHFLYTHDHTNAHSSSFESLEFRARWDY